MNKFTFSKENYRKAYGVSRYESAEVINKRATKKMWKDISEFMATLGVNGQDCIVHQDDFGEVVTVEFDYCEPEMGGMIPTWLTEDEENDIYNARKDKEVEDARKVIADADYVS